MTPARKKILVIDPAGQKIIPANLLPADFYDLTYTASEVDLVRVLSEAEPDLVVVDMTLHSTVGLSLLQQLQSTRASVPVLVLSPAGSVSTAVTAMKLGATEVVEQSSSCDTLMQAMRGCMSSRAPLRDSSLGDRTSRHLAKGDFGSMAGASTSMRTLFTKIEQIAQRDTTVLVTGESGTGKELVAREIHARSSRRDNPFVAINCAAIPETLIESELFGHEKGAFTHAVEKRLGQVELADGGTLFLDEIGELSLAVQVKLLRFLQEQEFYRVGRSKPIHVDLRVITATNRDLEEAVRLKTFRQDLLYRINVINLHIPALRDRREDIARLVSHCVSKLAPRYGGRTLVFHADAMQSLCSYPWPGNVRELENVLEGLLALSPSDTIEDADLPLKVRERRVLRELPVDSERLHSSGLAFGEAERIFETEMIVRALEKANYVQTRAAQLLGITRRILKYKMDKLGISDKGGLAGPGGDKSGSQEH
jgi:two-component system response regulator AtoC